MTGFTEVPCPFHGPGLVCADAAQVTVIPFGTVPVPVISPVVPRYMEVVPDTPGVMIVVVEVVTEPDITVVVRKMNRTQGDEVGPGRPVEIVPVHITPECQAGYHEHVGSRKNKIHIAPVMVEIIDISPVTVHMIRRVTVPEFIVRVSVIVVFIVPAVISLAFIGL